MAQAQPAHPEQPTVTHPQAPLRVLLFLTFNAITVDRLT